MNPKSKSLAVGFLFAVPPAMFAFLLWDAEGTQAIGAFTAGCAYGAALPFLILMARNEGAIRWPVPSYALYADGRSWISANPGISRVGHP